MAWPAIPAADDGTGSLQHDGDGQPDPAAELGRAARRRAGEHRPWTTVTPQSPAAAVTDPLLWIGLRIENSAPATLSFGIDRLLFNSALARTALTVPGAGTARAEQRPAVPGIPAEEPAAVPPPRNRPALCRPGGPGRHGQPGAVAGLDARGRPAPWPGPGLPGRSGDGRDQVRQLRRADHGRATVPCRHPGARSRRSATATSPRAVRATSPPARSACCPSRGPAARPRPSRTSRT